ncbi:Na+/H+ antiporter NhaA [Actinocorallia sp. B10E7]|uniref:Na+/H+ antiporter NhaA n=1 Tax=Actinocorallia sp. B10E7 TaxID=3153558 RepID=UPI00325CABA7
MKDSAPRRRERILSPLKALLHAESAGGAVLLVATVAALIWANSPFSDGYTWFWQQELGIGAGPLIVTEDLRHWVNDGLMTLFFFVVGLEVKRELSIGELHDPRAALLPAVAAAGGVILPALLFLGVLAATGGEGRRGWGIPMATDIAFAVGIMALLGRRVSAGAKLFLLSVAIVDDIIAIAVIALVYSDDVRPWWLAAAAAGLLAEAVLRWLGVSSPWGYVPAGVFVWFAFLESGVHATLAGVALGLLTPARPVGGREVLDEVEHALAPVSAFLVVPLFALANAGVDLRGGRLAEALAQPVAWAVIVGLVLGKLLGITGAARLFLRRGWATPPKGTRRTEVVGASLLGGIGFTVSLFIADLAFTDPEITSHAKVGIFTGSLAAALLGTAWLWATRPHRGRPRPRAHPRPERLTAQYRTP